MEDKELRDKIAILTARMLGVRDVVARLVAYQALNHSDPQEMLKHFSDATDSRIFSVSKKMNIQESPAILAMQEETRKQVDWIVAAAGEMLKDIK
jgi:hypothetical protein